MQSPVWTTVGPSRHASTFVVVARARDRFDDKMARFAHPKEAAMQVFQRATAALFAALFAGTAAAADADCVPQKDIDVAQIDARIVLVGETHGTSEIPRFTAGLVCSLLRAGKSVVLGVEHSGQQQESFNRYLRSAGSEADRQMLLQGQSWKTYADGRGSVAMLELVETLRKLRHGGQRVGVLAFSRNDNLQVPMEAADRAFLTPDDDLLQSRIADRMMADTVMNAAILYPRYVVVALAGSGHTSTVQGTDRDPAFMPMGQLLTAQVPAFIIGFETGGGEHWAYGLGGGRVRAIDAGPTFAGGTRVDQIVRIDRLTASKPARDATGP